MPLRMRVYDREPIGAALRRFKRLLERSGLKKELQKRSHYQKPSEVRRRTSPCLARNQPSALSAFQKPRFFSALRGGVPTPSQERSDTAYWLCPTFFFI